MIPIAFDSDQQKCGAKEVFDQDKKRTSVRGKALLKATAPKTFGTGDFFLMFVTVRTHSSISASRNSSEEIRVESRQSL
jgi:hypothetical protein